MKLISRNVIVARIYIWQSGQRPEPNAATRASSQDGGLVLSLHNGGSGGRALILSLER